MLDPENPLVAAALAADRQSARELIEALDGAGRGTHPAIDHLRHLVALPGSEATLLAQAAAVGFEAGVRYDLGRTAAEAFATRGDAGDAAPFIVDRKPAPWESHLPVYREVAWRIVIAARALDFAEGTFDLPVLVPGAALAGAIRQVSDRASEITEALLGRTCRDEVLDPVAAAGNFLAQALPGYVDLDLLLREHRLGQRTGT